MDPLIPLEPISGAINKRYGLVRLRTGTLAQLDARVSEEYKNSTIYEADVEIDLQDGHSITTTSYFTVMESVTDIIGNAIPKRAAVIVPDGISLDLIQRISLANARATQELPQNFISSRI